MYNTFLLTKNNGKPKDPGRKTCRNPATLGRRRKNGRFKERWSEKNHVFFKKKTMVDQQKRREPVAWKHGEKHPH